jgi:hypothetical protein
MSEIKLEPGIFDVEAMIRQLVGPDPARPDFTISRLEDLKGVAKSVGVRIVRNLPWLVND